MCWQHSSFSHLKAKVAHGLFYLCTVLMSVFEICLTRSVCRAVLTNVSSSLTLPSQQIAWDSQL